MPKKQSGEPKEPKEKVIRTPEQLATAHNDKVERFVGNVGKWLKKSGRALNSKKYPVDAERKAFALDYIAKKYKEFLSAMEGNAPAEEKFEFPKP